MGGWGERCLYVWVFFFKIWIWTTLRKFINRLCVWTEFRKGVCRFNEVTGTSLFNKSPCQSFQKKNKTVTFGVSYRATMKSRIFRIFIVPTSTLPPFWRACRIDSMMSQDHFPIGFWLSQLFEQPLFLFFASTSLMRAENEWKLGNWRVGGWWRQHVLESNWGIIHEIW